MFNFDTADFKFGAKPIREIDGPYSAATGVVECIDSSIIITTPGDLFRFESNEYKDRYYFKFIATARTKKNDILFGVTEHPTTIYVISLEDIGHPLLSGHPISQKNVKNMFYFDKSKMLLVVGDTVRCYGVNLNPFSIYLDKIYTDDVLKKDVVRSNHNQIIAIADYENEIIYLLSENEGFTGYDLNGIRTPHKNAQFVDSINHYCQNNLEHCLLYDKEHMILVLNDLSVYLLNIKTKIILEIIKLTEKPNRLFRADENKIALSYAGKISFYELTIFWSTWMASISSPCSIRRFNKLNSAARVLVQNHSNSNVYLISPRDGLEISKIETPNEYIDLSSNGVSPGPSQYFYDRGYHIFATYLGSQNTHVFRIKATTMRDRFFMISKEGYISVFNTNVWPFKEIAWKNAEAVSMTMCTYEGTWYYLIATMCNELLLMNTHTFEFTHSFNVTGAPILSVDYYLPTNLVLLIREQELTFYDLKRDWPISRTTVCRFNCIKMNGEIIYIGFKTGSIERISMTNRSLRSKEKLKIHDAPVNDFAFASSFWLSAAEDGSIYVWSYSLHAVFSKIYIPVPINCLSVINGHKDVVVGIDGAVMLLDKNQVFPFTSNNNNNLNNKRTDKELKSVDSHDRIKDRFVPIAADDPVRPTDYTIYNLSSSMSNTMDFPISINTFRPVSTSTTREIRPPPTQKNASSSSARATRPKIDLFSTSNTINRLSLNFESNPNIDLHNDDDQIIDQIEIENQHQDQNLQQKDDDEELDIDLMEHTQPYEHGCHQVHLPNSASSPSKTHRIIVAPLLTDLNMCCTNNSSFVNNSGSVNSRTNNMNFISSRIVSTDDELFENTQPFTSTATKFEIEAFANDADSDSEDEEFFRARFPIRMKSTVYVESKQPKKKGTPYFALPTDLYTTAAPKLPPRRTIVVPQRNNGNAAGSENTTKAASARKNQQLKDSDLLYCSLYLRKLAQQGAK